MKVTSALANMDVQIGTVRREGHDLILGSAPGSSIDAVIRLSAREVVRILALVLGSRAGLIFVLGLPFFWLRQRLAGEQSATATALGADERTNINKPW